MHYQSGEFDNAITVLKEAIKEDPENADAWNLLFTPR